jgi:hypothetical protein
LFEADTYIPRFRFNPSTRRIIMQDKSKKLPPIEGVLTDAELKQVAGASGPVSQNYQGNDDSQGNENQ